MGHGHAHEVAHFWYCKDRNSCFCEVNRYVLAAVVGLVAATAELGIAWYKAGSFGAESDAGHAYADSLFILISAMLALWKHYDKGRLRAIDDLGTWINSLFLIVAGGYIVYRLLYGERSVEFAGSMMFAAGIVGLAGNVGQFLALGEKVLEDAPDMHSTTRQHVFYDMLYSGAVMFASAIVIIMGMKVNFVLQSAVGFLMIVIAAHLTLRVIDTEAWQARGWTIFALIMSLVAVFVIILIVNGSTSAVDKSTAALLAVAMIGGGLNNFYVRYWHYPRRRKEAGHHHDHHHNHRH
jgi:Co/Zn/Cd efflux system component